MTTSCGVDHRVTLMLRTWPFLFGFGSASPVPNSATDNNKSTQFDWEWLRGFVAAVNRRG